MTEIKEYKTIRPRRAMLSESDIELQIYNTLRIINTTETLHHVLGHQDDLPNSNKQTWQATLNIRCDDLATETLKKVKEITTVLFLPASKIMLQIRETSITHHYAAQIRSMYSVPFQRMYLNYHHCWEKNMIQ